MAARPWLLEPRNKWPQILCIRRHPLQIHPRQTLWLRLWSLRSRRLLSAPVTNPLAPPVDHQQPSGGPGLIGAGVKALTTGFGYVNAGVNAAANGIVEAVTLGHYSGDDVAGFMDQHVGSLNPNLRNAQDERANSQALATKYPTTSMIGKGAGAVAAPVAVIAALPLDGIAALAGGGGVAADAAAAAGGSVEAGAAGAGDAVAAGARTALGRASRLVRGLLGKKVLDRVSDDPATVVNEKPTTSSSVPRSGNAPSRGSAGSVPDTIEFLNRQAPAMRDRFRGMRAVQNQRLLRLGLNLLQWSQKLPVSRLLEEAEESNG